MARTDIAIIGAGLGGLTCALTLRQRGLRADIYEAAPGLSEVGAGIWVPPNALQVLERLGVARAIEAAGAPIERIILADARDGTLQTTDLREVSRRLGFTTIAIHRARLQSILAHPVQDALHVGRRLVAVEPEASSVRLRFERGEPVEAGVVIGADGLRSVVREAISPRTTLRYSGQSSLRALTRWTLPASMDRVSWEVWASHARFGLSAIGDGLAYWYATWPAPPGEREPSEAMQRRAVEMAASFPAPIPALVTGTPADALLRTDLFDIIPVRSWHRGAIALLGDAAHATTPNLGQGGAQAIEDGFVLGEALASGKPVPEAFASYQHIRQAKAEHVVTMSRRIGGLVHWSNPVARWARNRLMRAVPASVAARQLTALYELNY